MIEHALLASARDAAFWATHRLQLTIPSMLQQDEEFDLRMTLFGPDGLPTADLAGEIVFAGSIGIDGLPRTARFDPAEGGHLTIPGLVARGPERVFVLAQPEGCPGPVCSNPAWVFPHEPPYRLWWGDIHIHTTYSNCSAWACQDPEFAYAFARYASHLDFAAPADHLRGIAAEPERWPRLQQLAKRYDEPGRFVPLLAFESSHAAGYGGDNNAYYLGTDGPMFWLDRDDMRGGAPKVALQELWDFLNASGEDFFTAPHHTGRAGKYRSFGDATYDPVREPIFEIYSCWGSSESRWNEYPLSGGNTDRPAYFVDALRAGCRYGLIASSDDHRTLPGGESPTRSPLGPAHQCLYPQLGLAAVRSSMLTREAIGEALRARACYATTFARTLLDMRVGDCAMGAEIEVGSGEGMWNRRDIRIRLLPPPNTRPTVVLVRNGKEIARHRWDGEDAEFVITDDASLPDVAITGAPFHPRPFVVYYLRVETGSRETQWSSPVWLDLV